MKRAVLIAALIVAATAPGVSAQAMGGGPGFLFREPRVSFGFRAGYSVPQSTSGIFAFPLDSLTINNFNAPYVGGEIAVRMTEHFDLAFVLGWTGIRHRSEYRNWYDQDKLPIEQETRFQTVAGTVGAKYYFGTRGRSIGRFAWVPAKFMPFVSAGVGAVWYKFKQAGDFIDFQSPTYDVFSDVLTTSSTAPIAQVGAGVDVSLTKNLILTGEGRFNVARADVNPPFDPSENIDLNGLQMMVGLGLRF